MAYEHTGRKFDPQSSNKYPDDGRQFVLHTSTGIEQLFSVVTRGGVIDGR
jgi:hypothetical protein